MTQTMQLPGHSPQEGTKIWEIVFSSGAFIAFLKFLQWLLGKIFDRKHKSDVLEGIEGLRAVYQVLEKALTHCDRALLLSAHNGGGVPNPATPFWVSAIHWAVGDPHRRETLNSYNRIRCDSHSITMLLTMMNGDGTYHFDMEKNDGAMLKAFYLNEGVVDAYLVFIGIRNGHFAFMSFASFTKKFTDADLTKFRLIANDVRNLTIK